MTRTTNTNGRTTMKSFARRVAAGIACFAFFAVGAFAQTADPSTKLSRDLRAIMSASSVSGASYARDTSAGRMVKVLVLARNTSDPNLQDLRRAIVAAGGTVYYRYISVSGVSAVMPTAKLLDIARRADVETLSPNRITSRTMSLLEKATGVADLPGTALDVDGSGVGIAFLDSGIMSSHKAFAGNGAFAASRVKKSVDFNKINESSLLGANEWRGGSDYSRSIYPGSPALAGLESTLNSAGAAFQDPYGHGTLVASFAAGTSVASSVDSAGVAPGASLFDVRVLNGSGIGDVGDALAGIDWVIYHAKEYNIRVLNISLATDSTDSYLTDPLCRAVRNAVAAGITVVVAAGNFGQTADGHERYGSITSPGNEPSAITVGSVNPHDSGTRGDDTLNFFSSRGPTRGGILDASGVRHHDNILKPDLVAPGNRLVGAMSTDALGLTRSRLALTFPQLVVQAGALPGAGLMAASGTSFSAPVVSGTVALMLQANPGLTPPLVKAILQYTAESLPGRNVLEQGAGLVNVVGALQLASVLQPNIAKRVDNGSLNVGDAIIAPGKAMPGPVSTIGGRSVTWSRFVYLGADQVFSGEDLFRKFQMVYDPAISWVRGTVTMADAQYFRTGASSKTYVSGFQTEPMRSGKLVSAGVLRVTPALGVSSVALGTGVFTPSISIGAIATAGIVLAAGIDIGGDGIVLAEGVDIGGDGIVLAEGIDLGDGIVLAEGAEIIESIVLAELGPMPGE
jgi:subtilisin family serine protease